MRGGNNVKPLGLKLVEGDTRQRGANKHAEAIKLAGDLPSGLPQMPTGLGPIARKHWKYLMNCAGAEKLFREADAGAIAAACHAYEAMMRQGAIATQLEQATLDTKKPLELQLVTAEKAIRARNSWDKAAGRYLAAADRLGLHAVSRARLQLGSKDDKNDFGMPAPSEWKSSAAGCGGMSG